MEYRIIYITKDILTSLTNHCESEIDTCHRMLSNGNAVDADVMNIVERLFPMLKGSIYATLRHPLYLKLYKIHIKDEYLNKYRLCLSDSEITYLESQGYNFDQHKDNK